MARPITGSILTRRLADDTLVFDAKIRGVRRLLGPEPEWTEQRARRLMENRLPPAARLNQPWWELIPSQQQRDREPAGALTVIDACTEYVANVEARLDNKNTINAYRTPVVKHVLPYFAYEAAHARRERPLTAIDEVLVGRFIQKKRAEREVMADLPEVLAELDDKTLRDPDRLAAQLDDREWELLWLYGQRGGRASLSDPEAMGRISLSSRGLTNNEINRCLARLRDIVRMANRRHGLGMDDPTAGQSLPRSDPLRDWLHPVQFQATLDVAKVLDAHPARAEYAHHGRSSAVLMLGLCGPRVSEFGGARWRDLSAQGLYVPESKTSAGRRHIELPSIVREALDTRREQLRPSAEDFIWGTARCTRRDRNNVRNRLLAPVLAISRQLLDARGQRPLPERVTPHTFRRTAMTYWAWADRNQRWAMGQAGHKSSKMTLECYQQSFPVDQDARAMVVGWLDGLS